MQGIVSVIKSLVIKKLKCVLVLFNFKGHCKQRNGDGKQTDILFFNLWFKDKGIWANSSAFTICLRGTNDDVRSLYVIP